MGKHNFSNNNGRIYIIGTGPGSPEHLTPASRAAIEDAEVVIGYKTYLEFIKDFIKYKTILSSGMKEEVKRCNMAVKFAREGRRVAVICGGDPGIYAMAGLIFEILRGQRKEQRTKSKDSMLDIKVIPGISALNACAARLGAPLMHDFASVSLSDLLTPWKVIEKRLEAVASTDFVIVIYNPKSKGRTGHIRRARDIILKYRPPYTAVGIVRAAMREDEDVVITNLKKMADKKIDMQSTVIIGNSQTFIWKNWMVTPRGYERKYKILSD